MFASVDYRQTAQLISLLCVLLFCPTAQAETTTVERASSESKQAAQDSFLEGDRAFDVQDYEQALRYFRASYSTVASPNSRLMIARSLLELRRLDEAYDEFLGVITDAGDGEKYTKTRETAERERDALLSRLAWLTVDMSGLKPGARLTVAGRVRDATGRTDEIAVTPGLTLVEARFQDGSVAQAEVQLAAGRRARVELILGETVHVGQGPAPTSTAAKKVTAPEPTSAAAAAEDQSAPPLLPWAIVASGVGVAGGITFAAMGSVSRGKFQSLNDECVDGKCPTGSQKEIDAGRQAQLIANVGLGVGIAGLATSAVLFILHTQRKPAKTELSIGPTQLNLRGSF